MVLHATEKSKKQLQRGLPAGIWVFPPFLEVPLRSPHAPSRSSSTSPSAPHLQPTQPGGTRANPTANTVGNSGRHTAPHNTCTGSRAARGLTWASPSPVCCEKRDPVMGSPSPGQSCGHLASQAQRCLGAMRCAQHLELSHGHRVR